MVRRSIRTFLEGAGLIVIGEAGQAKKHYTFTFALNPDVVVMDVHLPDMNGIEGNPSRASPTPLSTNRHFNCV
jgi:chemotaxis response regulator CheB